MALKALTEAPDVDGARAALRRYLKGGEAREAAVRRRALADAWVAARLEEATRFARENAQARRSRRPR